MDIVDINDRVLKRFDIIDIHQTVNGQNLFLITSLEPLHIVYYELLTKYEYDMEELLKPCRYSGEPSFEIVGNFNDSH